MSCGSSTCSTAQYSITSTTSTSITAVITPQSSCSAFESGTMWITLVLIDPFTQTGIFNLNPSSFTVPNLLPNTRYSIYANPYYPGGNCAGVQFNFQTLSNSSNTVVDSSNLTNYAFLSLLAIIPIFVLLLCCLAIVLIIIVTAVMKRKKAAKLISTVLLQTQKANGQELVESKGLQQTLKETLSKQYILDYNKIVFATEILGNGAQGTVYKGTYLMTDVAVKLLSTQNFGTDNDLTDFYNEAKLLAEHSNHPNIVKFIGVAHNPETNQIALITELCKLGNLANAVQSQQLTWHQKLKILFGVSSAMSHLHLANIIHRDLKAENILLDGDFCAKIIDFGFSKQIQDMNKTMNMTMNVGTASYVAPEVIKVMQSPITPVAVKRRTKSATTNENTSMQSSDNSSMQPFSNQTITTTSDSEVVNENRKKRQYDMKADVYSFGIILWVVYYESKHPYGKDASDFQIIHSLSTNQNMRPPLSDDIPQEEQWYIDIMKECWATNPEDRPSFEDICQRIQYQIEKVKSIK